MRTIIFLIVLAFIGCSQPTFEETPIYEVIETTFEGNPEQSKVKGVLERVMKKHGMEPTRSNIEKAASCLISLRKTGNGYTEMDILNRMDYQNMSGSFADNAATVAVYLEQFN